MAPFPRPPACWRPSFWCCRIRSPSSVSRVPAQSPPVQDTAATEPDPETPPDEPPTFLDSVTISANLRPARCGTRRGWCRSSTRDDPGTDDRGLVRPREVRAGGVRREQRDPSRAQRFQHPRHRRQPRDDAGRRRRDVGAVRFRPVQRPPGRARRGCPEDGRDRAQRQLRPLRQRRARTVWCRCSTKDPEDYLRDRGFYVGGKTAWDSRADEVGLNLTLAGGGERVQASVFASLNRGGEIGNQGAVDTPGPHPHGAESAGGGRPAGPRQAGLQRLAGQPVPHHRRALRHPRRNGVALEQPAARLRQVRLSHPRVGGPRHAEARGGSRSTTPSPNAASTSCRGRCTARSTIPRRSSTRRG